MYCCIIDFKKAFDTDKLIEKAQWFSTSGNLIWIIPSMYEKMKTCVQSIGMSSEFFMSNVGLLLGGGLSPMLYSIYIKILK